jgi:hypothetical protein
LAKALVVLAAEPLFVIRVAVAALAALMDQIQTQALLA